MRVLLDTNVLISYLIHPDDDSAISSILHAVFQERIRLLVPERLLVEFTETVQEKPRLARRIALDDLWALVKTLRALGEHIPEIEGQIPPISRDLKDDYLIAYALVGTADYLVTGDKDLLALQGRIARLDIVAPAEFAARL